MNAMLGIVSPKQLFLAELQYISNLERRSNMHRQDFHNTTLNREQMVSNTRTIRLENDFNRLEILEALYIKYTKPKINLQTTGRGLTLRLLGYNELSYATNPYSRHPTLTALTSGSPALSFVPDTLR